MKTLLYTMLIIFNSFCVSTYAQEIKGEFDTTLNQNVELQKDASEISWAAEILAKPKKLALKIHEINGEYLLTKSKNQCTLKCAATCCVLSLCNPACWTGCLAGC